LVKSNQVKFQPKRCIHSECEVVKHRAAKETFTTARLGSEVFEPSSSLAFIQVPGTENQSDQVYILPCVPSLYFNDEEVEKYNSESRMVKG